MAAKTRGFCAFFWLSGPPGSWICLVLSVSYFVFWPQGRTLSRSSRFSDLRKHDKTRGFGRDFPYRRVTLQNLDAQTPDFRRGAPNLGEVRDKRRNRSWSLFVRDCPKNIHLSKHLSKKQRFVSYLCLSKKGVKISLVLSVAMTSVHTGPWPDCGEIYKGYETKSTPKALVYVL